MKRNSKIIYKPEKMAKGRRLLERVLKFVFNALTLIATLALWIIFSGYISEALFLGSQFDDTVKMFGLVFIIAVIVFCVMLAWEQYNIRMFAGKNRRKFAPPVSEELLGVIYGIDTQAIVKLRNAKNIWLEEDRQQRRSSWYTDDGVQISAGVFADDYQRSRNS